MTLPRLPQSATSWADLQIWWQQVVEQQEAIDAAQDALIANLATTQAELTLAQEELEATQLELQQAQADLEQAFEDILAAQTTADSAVTSAATAQAAAEAAQAAADAAAADVAALGTAAQEDVGTSGATVPLLNGNNTWSGTQLHTAAFGYTTGAGGSVTQATSKTTGVTLNTLSGKITMNNAALAAGAIVNFLLTNSQIGTDDIVVVMITGAATNGAYSCGVSSTGAGTASIYLHNISAGSLSEAVELGFIVLRAATS